MARTARNDGKGVSLAKGPVAIVAIILIAFAVIALISGATQFKAKPIEGPVSGKEVLGLVVNGWSMLLTGAAGLLLLFGSPMHWAAKSLSLIVGLVLGAASVISLYDKQHDVFGIFAANGKTSLAWGIAAAVLLVLALLPRVGKNRGRTDEDYDGRDRDRVGRDGAVGSESSSGRRLRDRV